MRILVAESEPLILHQVAQLVKQAGHEVLTARNRTQTLRLALRERPQLCVVDPWLAGPGRFELVAALAKQGQRVLVYADPIEPDMERALESGAIGFVAMPATGAELLDAIEKALSAA